MVNGVTGDGVRDETIETSVKGRWVAVRSLAVGGTNIVVAGKLVRVATVHDEWWMETELEQPERVILALRHGKRGRPRADIFTFAQRVSDTTPKYSYPMEWDSVAAVRLSNFADWWERLPQVARKNTRRAAKRGVTTVVRSVDDDLVRAIVTLNNDSPFRQGTPFAHYGKTFEQVKKDYSGFADRSECVCAYVGEELIGLLRLVYCRHIGAILQLLTKESHYDRRPANVLIAKAVEHCEQKGLSFMTYGKYRYGNQEMTSLMEFKRRNGFEEIMVPRYCVPLTIRGTIGMKLRLHRDLVGILPKWAVAAGRRCRSVWRSLKQGAAVRRTGSHSVHPGGA